MIPKPDVVMLADDIAHWPQIEAPEAVLRHFLAHVDRVGRRDRYRVCAQGGDTPMAAPSPHTR